MGTRHDICRRRRIPLEDVSIKSTTTTWAATIPFSMLEICIHICKTSLKFGPKPCLREMAAACHELLNMKWHHHRLCVRMRSRRRIIMLSSSTLVMYLIMSMVLWDCGMGMTTFVEASHVDADAFGVIQRAGSSSSSSHRRFLSARSYSAGLCKSIIQVAGYPCEEIKVTARNMLDDYFPYIHTYIHL